MNSKEENNRNSTSSSLSNPKTFFAGEMTQNSEEVLDDTSTTFEEGTSRQLLKANQLQAMEQLDYSQRMNSESLTNLMRSQAHQARQGCSSEVGSTRAVEGGHAGSSISGGYTSDEEDGRTKQQLQRQRHPAQPLTPDIQIVGMEALKKKKNVESALVGLKADEPDNSKKRRDIIIMGIVLFVIVAIATGILLLPSDQNPATEDLEDLSDEGADVPLPPTAWQIFLNSTITEISDEATLSDETSPQYQAREWISNLDTQKATFSSEWRILQRYVLVTLYFATSHDESWTEPLLNPLTNECVWSGIKCQLGRIHTIDLSFRNLQGSLPPEIVHFNNLEELRLEENALTGAIPENLSELSRLKYLDLSENQMTGTIPPNLWSMTNLRYVLLSDNSFTGQIDNEPQTEGRTDSTRVLQQIFLQNNHLAGSIPSWMSQLGYLQHLLLGNNELTGNFKEFVLPTDNNLLVSLSWLDLSSNQFTGTLPAELFTSSSYPSLRQLYLDDNLLNGTLPNARQRNFLQNLWLNSNAFEGTIPTSFGYSSIQLEEVMLHNNSFIGTITRCSGRRAGYWPKIEHLEADCNLPSVDCSCCTKCYPE